MKVKLSEIIDEINLSDRFSEYLLDAETGELVYIHDMNSKERDVIYNQLDKHGFYHLPSSFEMNESEIVREFVAGLPKRAASYLATAIRGTDNFSQFKDGVIEIGLEQAWYDFHDNAHKCVAIRWCKENGIEYEE